MKKNITVYYGEEIYELGFSFLLKDFIYQAINDTEFNKKDIIIGMKNIINILENNIVFKNYNKDETEDDYEDDSNNSNFYDGYYSATPVELIVEFNNTEIAKAFSEGWNTIRKAQALENYENDVVYRLGILSIYKKHIEKWIEIVGNLNDYHDIMDYSVFEDCIKAMVVYQKEKVIDRIRDIFIDIHNILTSHNIDFYDLDILNHQFKKYKNDIKYSKMMMKYISDNPGILQKNIFKLLSLDGRKCSYILESAAKINVINRTRFKDTWSLKLNKNKKKLEITDYL